MSDDDNMDNTQALLDAGGEIAGIEVLHTQLEHPEDDRIRVPVAIVQDDKGRRVVLLEKELNVLDSRLPGPRRRTESIVLTEEASFIAAINRWATPTATIYAQTAGFSFVALLDDHPQGPAGTAWRQHRASYTCPRSNEWKIWTGADGKGMGQVEFAEFVESRLEDMVDPAKQDPPPEETYPAPLYLMTMARNLQILTKGTYVRSLDPTTGQYEMINKNENAVGSTVIPRAFLIAIPVFDGGDRYRLEARIRFALVEGAPRFSFTLHRRAEVERMAFNTVRAKVAADTGLPLFAGSP